MTEVFKYIILKYSQPKKDSRPGLTDKKSLFSL